MQSDAKKQTHRDFHTNTDTYVVTEAHAQSDTQQTQTDPFAHTLTQIDSISYSHSATSSPTHPTLTPHHAEQEEEDLVDLASDNRREKADIVPLVPVTVHTGKPRSTPSSHPFATLRFSSHFSLPSLLFSCLSSVQLLFSAQHCSTLLRVVILFSRALLSSVSLTFLLINSLSPLSPPPQRKPLSFPPALLSEAPLPPLPPGTPMRGGSTNRPVSVPLRTLGTVLSCAVM
jgi:hypothetical protein